MPSTHLNRTPDVPPFGLELVDRHGFDVVGVACFTLNSFATREDSRTASNPTATAARTSANFNKFGPRLATIGLTSGALNLLVVSYCSSKVSIGPLIAGMCQALFRAAKRWVMV